MPTHSPLSDTLVTVFGGGGFIGNYVAQALLARGARVRIASRHPEQAWGLKPLANLGQLQFARCDILDGRSLEAAIQGSTRVVNLVGAFKGDLMEIMGRAPGRMAAIAAAQGVKGFVHLSAIGADQASETRYGKAKAAGEDAVLAAFPSATILRPSIVFGKDDDFLNMFGSMIETVPVLPVFAHDAKLQLVFVDDVAEAVAVALENPAEHGGHTYELGGPEEITMIDLHKRIAASQGRERRFACVSDSTSRLFAMIPGTPMSMDQWKLLRAGSTVSPDARTFADLGITPRPLGLYLDKWMTRYRKHGRFGLQVERNRERELRGVPAPSTGAGAEI